MKKALIPLLACFYVSIGALVFIALIIIDADGKLENVQWAVTSALIVFGIACLLVVPLLIVNIVVAIILKGNNGVKSQKKRALTIMWLKLAMIPYFAANFILWFILMAPTIVIPGFQLFIPIPISLGAFCAYLALLSTSIHEIALIARLRSNGILSTGKCALNIILQLLFLIDVISSICIAVKLRNL
jgi:hypothetical protein